MEKLERQVIDAAIRYATVYAETDPETDPKWLQRVDDATHDLRIRVAALQQAH